MLVLIVFIILVALAFDYINGFHDAANSIATVVSTRVLSPSLAVWWAAFFNFIAAFGLGVQVARTIGTGIVEPWAVNEAVILAALVGAIAWNLITWYYGIPSSSSHALIGGFASAAVVHAGFGALIPAGLYKVGFFIVLSRLLGLLLGLALMVGVIWLCWRMVPGRIDRVFRRLQLVSAAFYSLGHGTNDAQKTMGMRITTLRPVGGFCAESAGAITLIGTALAGIPVSTTHTIIGAIVGAGPTRRLSAVRWGIAATIVWAWILTIPAAGLIAALAFLPLRLAGW